MTELSLFQIDAFTARLFSGNPAAVVPLEEWLPDEVMQRIALENNLSETAFFAPASVAGAHTALTDLSDADYALRWFTPNLEADLCGHATLATAHVLFHHLGCQGDTVRFASRSGTLGVKRDPASGRLVLDFPIKDTIPVAVTNEMAAALGARPASAVRSDALVCIFETEAQLAGLVPDFRGVAALDPHAVMVTAPGDDGDYVVRYFAPVYGIDEDPVTGSASCTLAPLWADRLGRSSLHARQLSPRGGDLYCHVRAGEGRVDIGGHAVTYLEGSIRL